MAARDGSAMSAAAALKLGRATIGKRQPSEVATAKFQLDVKHGRSRGPYFTFPVFPPSAATTPLAAVTSRDPYPYYAALLADRPLYRDEMLGLWVASSARAVTDVLDSALCRVRPPAEPVPKALLGTAAGSLFGRLVRMNDGAGHGPLKHAISRTLAFLDSTAAAALSRNWAEALALDAFKNTGTRDLDAFVFALPVSVLASLLGLPQTSFPVVARAVDDFVGALAPGASGERLDRASGGATVLLALLGAHFAAPSAEGLLERLQAEATAVALHASDVLVANAVGFLTQAYEATAGLIGNALLALGARPALVRALRRQPALLGDLLAEVLRHDPPVQNTRRFVASDGVVAGERMTAGDAILVVLAAANRDPSANARPERFELSRKSRRSFGHGHGVHACPAQALSLTIARAGVERLLAADLDFGELLPTASYRPSQNLRIPRFAKEGETRWLPSFSK
jgi:cytochrome P450